MDTTYNAKGKFIDQVLTELHSHFNIDEINIISNIMLSNLNNYDMSKKCTDIVVYQNKAQQILNMFTATKKIEGRSDGTLRLYRHIIQEMFQIIGKDIDDIYVGDLRCYLAKKRMDGCSARTTSSYRSALLSFFNWAHNESLISHNPTVNLGVIKYKRDVKLPFTNIELQSLREHCTNTRDRAIIELLLASGGRISEILNAKLSDIDLKEMELKVLGKGNKERIVYFDSVTAMWIQRYLKTRTDDIDLLFINRFNNLLTPNAFRMKLSKVAKSANVTNVHPHRFRDTFATTFIRRGMNVQTVSRLLGHVSLNTTMGYVYMDDAGLKRTYKQFAAE